MKTVTNITGQSVRAISPDAMHSTSILAGETKEIRDELFASACAGGCVPAGDNSNDDNPATEIDESRVIMLESMINAVLDEGDESLLTKDGCPKASILKDRFGSHSTEEREQAWSNVKSTRDLG